MIMNEKIKASEVELTGLDGEPLGVMATAEALALARKLKVDLVCDSLMSSPPPCRLIPAEAARQAARAQARAEGHKVKVKEIRLTPQIEAHDYETKRQQAERMLKAGDAVLFTVKLKGKEGAAAKKLLEELSGELRACGRPVSGIQLSGKQAAVQLDPVKH